jgi:formate dehydrogenase (coenzyme F420) beta subunit
MQELRDLARKLLADGAVGVVIGYEEGPHGVRPAFITDQADAARLVFDRRCVQNLATYLAVRRHHLGKLGKKAIVVKGCDARAVAGLIRETQVKREDVVIIGARCGGVLRGDAGTRGNGAARAADAPLTPETVADRCAGCEVREPHLADHLVGELPPPPPVSQRRDELIAKIEAMPPAERWDYWQAELERCVLCHACREVCPMCFCERCVADKTVPQWLESSPHGRANLAWHLTRALHQAGRCCDCGECERACPVDIPLGLLNRKLAKVVEECYDFRATDDPEVPAPIGSYKLDDPQEFIL